MKTIEVTGKTLDEAKMNALLELGASSDQVSFEVLDEGSKGLLGLLRRSVKVRATLQEEEEDDLFSLKASEKKEPVQEKKEYKEKKQENKKAFEPAKEEDHLNDEIRTFDAVEAVTVTGEKVMIDDTIEQRLKKANENKKKQARPEHSERRNERPERPSRRFEEEKAEEEKPVFEPKVYEIPKDSEAVMEQCKSFLTALLKEMGIETTVSCHFSEEGILEANIEGEGMGIIIGKRGATLDSLQYLTTLVINKGRQDHVRMKLDTEGYRMRRQETLEKLAINLAKKAKRTGHRVVLEPMNPYERRIIHSILQQDRGVETHSDGEEPYRKVVITPKRRR